MKYILAGGTGRLGRALSGALASSGHSVVVLSRNPSLRAAGRGVHEVPWSPNGTVGDWAKELSGADAVINLAGADIAGGRWTQTRKDLLRSSRVLSTRSLAKALPQASPRPPVFVLQTGVGYYGASLDTSIRTEESPPGDDFLGRLAREWEAEAAPISASGTRLVVVRSGVVLEPNGGALPKMALPFKFFIGGPVGSGRQYLSWIHIDDWVRLVIWSLRTPSVSGAINATAPVPVTNREFSRALGAAMGRPAWAPVPGFMLRTLFGELADAALLNGQRAVPKRAQELGFQFEFPTVEGALRNLLT
jgi:uncharacterized protein (TIGR01777 family)